jgi:hypothetical protein
MEYLDGATLKHLLERLLDLASEVSSRTHKYHSRDAADSIPNIRSNVLEI